MIRDSATLLFTFCKFTIFKKPVNELKVPSFLASNIAVIADVPTFFIAERPKRIALPVFLALPSGNHSDSGRSIMVKSVRDSLTSGGRTLMPSFSHSEIARTI